MAVLRGHEVLHHLDLDVCCGPRDSEVFHLHHHPAHRLHKDDPRLHDLGSARSDVGILSYHIPWNPALLPTGSRNLDANIDPQWRGHMCPCRHVRHHWPCCHCVNDRNRPGTGCCAGGHAVEHANEEASQNSSFWFAVFRVDVRILSAKGPMQYLTSDSASVITMVRIPYVNKFERMTNLQCEYIR